MFQKQQVQMLLQQAVTRMRMLQSPSPDIVNILKSIYNTPPASCCGIYGTNTTTTTTSFGNASNTPGAFNQQQSTPFGQQPSSSVFAQPNQNIFAKSAQPPNQFGATSSSIFGGGTPQNQGFKGQTNNSVFANNQVQPQSDIFRQANTNFGTQGSSSIFGGQPTTTQVATSPIFTGPQPTNTSIFGGGQPTGGSIFTGQTNPLSIFGGQQNVSPQFSSQTQPLSGNVFSNQSPNTTFGQNIFGASSNNQTFGVPAPVQSIPQQTSTSFFGMGPNQPQNAQQSIFGQQQPSVFSQQNTGAIFNQQMTNPSFGQISSSITDAKSHSNSIFGSSQNTVISNSPFGQVQQIDETVYSKLEDLTEDEVKWFNSDDLDILNIPEKPPTYQMCFKT